MSATGPFPGAVAPSSSPYRGLLPYTEDDAPYFFGRDNEREIVTANLVASRLTVLYGQSGAGKTSFLRAGVASGLRSTREDSAKFLPVVCGRWSDRDAATAVATSIWEAAHGDGERLPPPGDLSDTIIAVNERLNADVLVILDQMEEYFLYHGVADEGPAGFGAQFARAVGDPGLPANFLLAIRDDELARLDRFKTAVPGVFDNLLRLELLGDAEAREAIRRPIEMYNQQLPAGREPVRIEPELVDALLAELAVGRFVLPDPVGDRRVALPELQLVLTRLWSVEVAEGSTTLRHETLERLGGAGTVVASHLDNTMAALSEREQVIAADVFRFLVTPTGLRIALTATDLSVYTSRPVTEVAPVLARLTADDSRVLRAIPPSEPDDEARYELFSGALGPAIVSWRDSFETVHRLYQSTNPAEMARRVIDRFRRARR